MKTKILFLMSLVLTLNISTSTSQANQLNGGFESTTSQERAREIMGRNFLGVEEATQHFGVNPTRQQLDSLWEIPFSEAMLEESKDTHVLIAVFPLLHFPGEMVAMFFLDEERGEVSWQLVRKTPVANSTSRDWGEQQALLAKNDEVPTARVMAYTIIEYYLVTGERLFEHIYVRTSSGFSVGRRVFVGYFASRGLCVSYCYDDRRDDRMGVSSARKSPH